MLLFFYFSAKIEGCIICNDAKILEKVVMKDCEVAGGFVVKKESK
jgi:translation initiation factor eIF-2B subunit gamma